MVSIGPEAVASSAPNKIGVNLQKDAGEQQEKVVSTILEGAEEAAKAPREAVGTGVTVDEVA